MPPPDVDAIEDLILSNHPDWVHHAAAKDVRSHALELGLHGMRMAQEIRRLRSALYDTQYHLSRAFCWGIGWTDEYGWPTGDHTAETMADHLLYTLAALNKADT